MFPKQQSFFVLGLSKSGNSAAEFLLKRGAKTYVYDDVGGEKISRTIDALCAQGAILVKAEEIAEMTERCDALVLSPGIPIDHPIAVSFKRAKKAIVGETELAVRNMKGLCVGVTGTNGKTTTVSMLTETLCAGGFSAVACGNIGTPMIAVVEREDCDVAVAEISSFQMETLNSFCPHVAVVLNVTEDHLNRHYNMENYVFLKKKLLKNLTETEYAVLNYDDRTARGFAEGCKAQTVWFSVKEKVNGAYLLGGALYYGEEKVLAADELPVGGLHNVQNALATIAVAKILGVETQTVASALKAFKGVKHRIERIGEWQGVTYVDDSKGTNVDATVKAVECMRSETVLLLGGKDKGYDYKPLFSALKNSKVVHAVLYGENRYKLLDGARACGYEALSLCADFERAVKLASLTAKEGQTVLLSPASASFDEFTGYEERGERFVGIFKDYVCKGEAVERESEETE